MKVQQLRQMIEVLENVYTAAGAKGPAADLTALARAMSKYDELDFNSYLDALRAELLQPSVADYIVALKACALDEDKFAATYAKLQSDHALKSSDLADIGAAYTEFSGFGKLYKARSERLEQIRRSFFERLSYERRGRVVDTVSPWQ